MKSRVGILNAFVCVWLLVFCRVAFAQSSFSADVHGYDVESLAWAALMSLFGGALRTIFTLAEDNAVVISVVRELWKDAVVAVVAGTVTYILVEAFRATEVLPVPSEVRFAAIVFAGWSRLSFFGWLNRMGEQVSMSVTDRAVRAFGGHASTEPNVKKPPFNEE